MVTKYNIAIPYLCKHGDTVLLNSHITKYEELIDYDLLLYSSWKYSLYGYGCKILDLYLKLMNKKNFAPYYIYKFGTIKQIEELTKKIELIWCIDAKKICAPLNKVNIPSTI